MLLSSQRKVESVEGTANCQVKIFTSGTFNQLLEDCCLFSCARKQLLLSCSLFLCADCSARQAAFALQHCFLALSRSSLCFSPFCNLCNILTKSTVSIMLQTPNDSRLLATCVSPSGMKVVSGGCHITFVYIVGNFWRLIHNLHKIIQRSHDTTQKEAFPTKLHVFFEIMQWCFRKCKLTADFRGNATMISCW